MSYILYWIVKILGTPIFYLLFMPRYKNRKNIPKNASVVLAGNHKSNFDCASLVCSTNRVIHFLAKKELLDTKMKWFFRMVGCISVDRENHEEAKKAKEKAISILKKGGAIGIFPEGTRNKTDAFLLPFKYGAVSMAKKTDATIVPFAVTGKYEKGGNLMVRFGEPFKVTDMTLEEANDKLFNVIKSLKEENLKATK